MGVCIVKMTFYKLSRVLKPMVIADKIDEKLIEKVNRSLWALFCGVSHVYG